MTGTYSMFSWLRTRLKTKKRNMNTTVPTVRTVSQPVTCANASPPTRMTTAELMISLVRWVYRHARGIRLFDACFCIQGVNS